jgi:hypothetical protein
MKSPRRRGRSSAPADTSSESAKTPELRPLVRPSVAAPLLGTTMQSLRQARHSGRGTFAKLRYYKTSARDVRYDLGDIIEMRKACLVEPKGEDEGGA